MPPELLFIERAVQLLKPGTGRVAIVLPNGILNNPGTAYVRQWILEHTQVLAVVDMNRDLFQPKNDTQTSIVVMRRLNESELEQARQSGLEYPIFMAVAETIGHDKRGNVTYKRSADGQDVLVSRLESVPDIDPETGSEILRTVEIRDRVIDDELADVADAYKTWLAAQS